MACIGAKHICVTRPQWFKIGGNDDIYVLVINQEQLKRKSWTYILPRGEFRYAMNNYLHVTEGMCIMLYSNEKLMLNAAKARYEDTKQSPVVLICNTQIS